MQTLFRGDVIFDGKLVWVSREVNSHLTKYKLKVITNQSTKMYFYMGLNAAF